MMNKHKKLKKKYKKMKNDIYIDVNELPDAQPETNVDEEKPLEKNDNDNNAPQQINEEQYIPYVPLRRSSWRQTYLNRK